MFQHSGESNKHYMHHMHHCVDMYTPSVDTCTHVLYRHCNDIPHTHSPYNTTINTTSAPHSLCVIYRGVNLAVRKGEFVCIFGTSGGGKTTMLNIMGTIDKPTKGELRLCGISMLQSIIMKEREREIAYYRWVCIGVTQNTKDSDLSKIRLQKV